METKDILLKKAVFEDWEAMYRNVWSHEETARYMMWSVTTNEEAAQERMRRTIQFQSCHDTYFVYEKESGQAIGFAGIEKISDDKYEEVGIALGPEYVGKGYGKQILQLLVERSKQFGAKEFYYSSRRENEASLALAKSCGFQYNHSHRKRDEQTGTIYTVDVFVKQL